MGSADWLSRRKACLEKEQLALCSMASAVIDKDRRDPV